MGAPESCHQINEFCCAITHFTAKDDRVGNLNQTTWDLEASPITAPHSQTFSLLASSPEVSESAAVVRGRLFMLMLRRPWFQVLAEDRAGACADRSRFLCSARPAFEFIVT